MKKGGITIRQTIFDRNGVWIGSANVQTGKIEETHSFAEAEKADFRTSFYFSEEQEDKCGREECIFFWLEDGGVIQLSENKLGESREKELIEKIREQLEQKDDTKGLVLRNTIGYGNGEEQDRQEKQIFILYTCNEWKETSSMRAAGATSDINVLCAMVGSKIKAGEMLYRSDNRDESWECFKQDHQRNKVMLDCLVYGYIETMTDLSLSDPELAEEFEEALSVNEALQRSRTEELLRPLALDRQRLVFSIVDMQSDCGCERVFLPGYGTEESLKQSEGFRYFTEDDGYMDIHVDVSSYIVGTGEVREADWNQTQIIEAYFMQLINLHKVNLWASDCYDTYYEMGQEEP